MLLELIRPIGCELPELPVVFRKVESYHVCICFWRGMLVVIFVYHYADVCGAPEILVECDAFMTYQRSEPILVIWNLNG